MEPRATVVSILPFEINDSKPNLYPGNFIIPAGDIQRPGLLSVGKSAFYIPMAFGAPSLQAFSSPFEVATSIVNDWVGAMLTVSEDARPGIFVANKSFKSQGEAAGELATEIADRLQAQHRWFVKLVNEADKEYRTHNNGNAISDLQKVAARQLNLKDRPWLMDLTQMGLNNCPACYNPININAIICGHCKYVVNPEKYAQMTFASGIPSISMTPPVESKVG
jgi:hypothetical protein